MPQQQQPPQQQDRRPGLESAMTPRPQSENPDQRGTGKLLGKVAIITGGDSGIGRAVAIAFAKDGADVVILYLNEHQDAKETTELVEKEGRRCLALAGDVGTTQFCAESVDRKLREFGHLDILVNNAAEQHPQDSITSFRPNSWNEPFARTSSHLPEGGAIVNTTSVTAYRGSWHLLDYSSTKGAIVSFTRSLSQALADKKIRVNAVAPGPIWTPLIPSTFPPERLRPSALRCP